MIKDFSKITQIILLECRRKSATQSHVAQIIQSTVIILTGCQRHILLFLSIFHKIQREGTQGMFFKRSQIGQGILTNYSKIWEVISTRNSHKLFRNMSSYFHKEFSQITRRYVKLFLFYYQYNHGIMNTTNSIAQTSSCKREQFAWEWY